MNSYSIAAYILFLCGALTFLWKKHAGIAYIFVGLAFGAQGMSNLLIRHDNALAVFGFVACGFIIGCAVTRMRYKGQDRPPIHVITPKS